jgi:hypothetical protein
MRHTLKRAVWKWLLNQLRAAVWAADEWIHAQELELRESAMALAPPIEFDRKASAARERVHKKAARAARPRLVYAGGQFVRKEGTNASR